jgi:hypothetical protein
MPLPLGSLLLPFFPGLVFAAWRLRAHVTGLSRWWLLVLPVLLVKIGCTAATSCAGCACCHALLPDQGIGLNEIGSVLATCRICDGPRLMCPHRLVFGNAVLVVGAWAISQVVRGGTDDGDKLTGGER